MNKIRIEQMKSEERYLPLYIVFKQIDTNHIKVLGTIRREEEHNNFWVLRREIDKVFMAKDKYINDLKELITSEEEPFNFN